MGEKVRISPCKMIYSSSMPDVEFPMKDIFSAVFKDYQLKAQKIAIIDAQTGVQMNYQKLHDSILCLSAALQSILELQKGEILCILSPNHIQYPIVAHACVNASVVVSPANPNYVLTEFVNQLKDSSASCIVAHKDVLELALEAAKIREIPRNRVICLGDHDIEGITCVSTLIVQGKPLISTFSKPKLNLKELLNNPSYLCYSSGTTGLPKGVITTNINIVSNIYQFHAFYNPKQDQDAVHLAVLPFYHIYGLQIFLNCAFFQGHTIVIQSKFEISNFVEIIEKYQVTHLNMVPPIAIKLVQFTDRPINLSSVRSVVCGAAALPEQISDLFQEKFNIKIKQGYGMTELSPVGMKTPDSDVITGTVGVLAPNMYAKIISESGTVLGYRQPGELCLCGPNIMKGYWNQPQATRQTLIDGWLHTGDTAMALPNGHFKIIGRKKEIIKFNGVQISPNEIEAVLLEHPDILDAAVIGIPHPSHGQVPRAFIVASNDLLTEKDIHKFLINKISSHKRLRGGVEFVNSIPKSPSGKVLRRFLVSSFENVALAKL